MSFSIRLESHLSYMFSFLLVVHFALCFFIHPSLLPPPASRPAFSIYPIIVLAYRANNVYYCRLFMLCVCMCNADKSLKQDTGERAG